MQKVNISSRLVNQPITVNLANVVGVTISNYGNTVVQYRLNGILRKLPVYDEDLSLPISPFVIECSGFTFDIELEFIDAENVVLDYATPKKQC